MSDDTFMLNSGLSSSEIVVLVKRSNGMWNREIPKYDGATLQGAYKNLKNSLSGFVNTLKYSKCEVLI